MTAESLTPQPTFSEGSSASSNDVSDKESFDHSDASSSTESSSDTSSNSTTKQAVMTSGSGDLSSLDSDKSTAKSPNDSSTDPSSDPSKDPSKDKEGEASDAESQKDEDSQKEEEGQDKAPTPAPGRTSSSKDAQKDENRETQKKAKEIQKQLKRLNEDLDALLAGMDDEEEKSPKKRNPDQVTGGPVEEKSNDTTGQKSAEKTSVPKPKPSSPKQPEKGKFSPKVATNQSLDNWIKETYGERKPKQDQNKTKKPEVAKPSGPQAKYKDNGSGNSVFMGIYQDGKKISDDPDYFKKQKQGQDKSDSKLPDAPGGPKSSDNSEQGLPDAPGGPGSQHNPQEMKSADQQPKSGQVQSASQPEQKSQATPKAPAPAPAPAPAAPTPAPAPSASKEAKQANPEPTTAAGSKQASPVPITAAKLQASLGKGWKVTELPPKPSWTDVHAKDKQASSEATPFPMEVPHPTPGGKFKATHEESGASAIIDTKNQIITSPISSEIAEQPGNGPLVSANIEAVAKCAQAMGATAIGIPDHLPHDVQSQLSDSAGKAGMSSETCQAEKTDPSTKPEAHDADKTASSTSSSPSLSMNKSG